MNKENNMQSDNSLQIDRRSLLKGMGIAAAGLVTLEAARQVGVSASNAHALSAHTDGQFKFAIVRKPRFKAKKMGK